MNINIKTALISVSDKTNLIPFAQGLIKNHVQIFSTGGTADFLIKVGIPVTFISELSGFPEIMEGRVKTLHPKIHGGILGLRDQALHQEQARNNQITWIDLVVVNLYPFEQVISSGAAHDQIIENIDIGGSAMLRAAAKNYQWVTGVFNPEDYFKILEEIENKSEVENKGVSLKTRQELAGKIFALTADYDQKISNYFLNKKNKKNLSIHLETLETLRYGENPHQQAILYQEPQNQLLGYGLAQAKIIQGKALSYNNLMDAEAALQCVRHFKNPAAVIVKHANPCGASMAEDITNAYSRAFQADPQSSFGGIIALNQMGTKEIAEHVSSIFIELILAPGFTPEALEILKNKPNLRVIQIQDWEKINTPYAFRAISGGLLMQDADQHELKLIDLKIVTENKPSPAQIQELLFAWNLVKYLKSNAIAIIQDCTSLGLSGGQVSRISALNFALERARNNPHQNSTPMVLASDAFFPFRDSIDALKNSGVTAIIQPGGSIRDAEIIQACNELDISMVFTGIRCFNH